jgi:hypothetical protein
VCVTRDRGNEFTCLFRFTVPTVGFAGVSQRVRLLGSKGQSLQGWCKECNPSPVAEVGGNKRDARASARGIPTQRCVLSSLEVSVLYYIDTS